MRETINVKYGNDADYSKFWSDSYPTFAAEIPRITNIKSVSNVDPLICVLATFNQYRPSSYLFYPPGIHHDSILLLFHLEVVPDFCLKPILFARR